MFTMKSKYDIMLSGGEIMEINDRLRFLRKHLGLTTRAFGLSINMSGGAITNMEKGTRNITDRTIKDICREYDINPEWLINGTEPMRVDEDYISDLNVDDEVKQLMNQYNMLNEKDRELIKGLIDSLYEKITLQNHNSLVNRPYPDIPDTLEECLAKYPPSDSDQEDGTDSNIS